MQRLNEKIAQNEEEIKEVTKKVEKEKEPALKLEAEKQLTALRVRINKLEDQKILLMQQKGESQLALLIKISLPCIAKS